MANTGNTQVVVSKKVSLRVQKYNSVGIGFCGYTYIISEVGKLPKSTPWGAAKNF